MSTTIERQISYSRDTRDYDAHVKIDDQWQYIGSAPTHLKADRLCDDYAFHYYADNHTPEVAAQIAAAGACWEEAGAPTQAELREWAIADEAPDGCSACGDEGCPYCDPELGAETPPPPGMATPVEPPPSVFDPAPRLRPEAVTPMEPEIVIGRMRWNEHDQEFRVDPSIPAYECERCGQYRALHRRGNTWLCDECDALPVAAVVTIAHPPAPTAIRLIPCADIDLTDPAVVARLAALSPSDLEWQAAVYAAYRSLGSQHVTTAALTDFRRAIAVQLSGAVAQSADAVCHVIFELALTDIPALIEFLRGHTDQQRERVAWRYAAWLNREHGICREPAFLRRCWDVLLVGASASGMGETDRAQAQPGADSQGLMVEHGPSTNGANTANYTTEVRR